MNLPNYTQWLKTLPEEDQYEPEERAAIKEYDDGMSREQAEREAMEEVRERWGDNTEADATARKERDHE